MRTFKTGISIDVRKAEKQPRVEDDPSFGYSEVRKPHFFRFDSNLTLERVVRSPADSLRQL